MGTQYQLKMLSLNYHGLLIHPVLLMDENVTILIDTGFPGQFEELLEAMSQAGSPVQKLDVVLLTHQDLDHIGNLPDILKFKRDSLKVYAHRLEKPYIQAELPLLKDPDHAPLKGRVDHELVDGQVLPFFDGITVIHTPGHTPGHVSFYLNREKILVAGDSMYSENGTLGGVHAPTTHDVETAKCSLRKYLDFDVQTVICYHGGIVQENVNDQIRKLCVL
ncbi:MBL fold metallo-hydrolase [Paenibacillus sp. FSL W8-0186]|uniref:MBL fold metallo-hydrolase n=1 Tax=Paenibacillus sp. FSL W8-0186 TaxID=2921709 RepID=UPI0030D1B6BC